MRACANLAARVVSTLQAEGEKPQISTTALIMLNRNCNEKPQTSAKETSMAVRERRKVLSLRKTHLGNVRFPVAHRLAVPRGERFSVSSFPKKICSSRSIINPATFRILSSPLLPFVKLCLSYPKKKRTKAQKKPPQGLLECFSMFCCRSRLPFQRLQEQQQQKKKKKKKIFKTSTRSRDEKKRIDSFPYLPALVTIISASSTASFCHWSRSFSLTWISGGEWRACPVIGTSSSPTYVMLRFA